MRDLQHILEECLRSLSNGTATLDECLALYSEHAEQLKPLLETAFLLNSRRTVMPSSTFSAFARFALIQFARSHPRQQRGVVWSWRMATTLAMLVVALLVTGTTVHAQSALPGDIDYGWKRTSELAWRALAPDPVAVDIVLTERRLNEWIAVANDSTLNARAMNSYQEAVSRLKSTDNAEARARIVPELQSQQQTLNDAGLSTPELDDYLLNVADVVPIEVPTQVTPTEIVATATLTSSPADIVQTETEVPPTDVPLTATEVSPTATEVPPTATEVPPTATEIPPTATEVPPTDIPTEIAPTVAPAPSPEFTPTDELLP